MEPRKLLLSRIVEEPALLGIRQMCIRSCVIATFYAMLLPFGALAADDVPNWRKGLEAAMEQKENFWKSDPLLYEPNNSYFQLVLDFGGQRHNGIRWADANAKASMMQYQGRRGRLAIIDSPMLYDWLSKQLNLSGLPHGGNTWFGLKYWCGFRQMTWSSGKQHPFSSFSAWDTPWHWGDIDNCNIESIEYMGTYIDGSSLRWKAVGEKKAFPYFLVEYPAPDPGVSDQESRK